MSIAINRFDKRFYVVGGTIRRDAPCYVRRQADDELYQNLKDGHFCYALTARQMGKSSLMVRTAARLRDEGVGVAVLDLTAIGQNLSAEQWYGGLLTQLGQQLDLEEELLEFRRGHEELGPLQRWMLAIERLILPRYVGQVVIFVDEIDTVRSLSFPTDEFFAGIREFYNRRAEDQAFERLVFCLLGVASPSDLIRDTRMTPFNIGRRIELHDFSELEAMPLARGLRCGEQDGTALIKRVLFWTGGHPYLTQRLCLAIAEADPQSGSALLVDRLCEELFFGRRAREQDDNLLFVRERLLRSEVDMTGLLNLYLRVCRGRRVADDDANPLVTVLRLTGITRAVAGRLMVRNRIYERVFDRKWAATNLPDVEVRRQRTAYRKGLLRAGSLAAVILAIVSVLALTATKQRNRANEQERANRRLLYTAQMKLAAQDWEHGDIARSREYLDACIPNAGLEDFRGFEWYYIWRQCHRELVSLPHDGPVDREAFSLDGRTLISRSNTKGIDPFGPPASKVSVWNIASGSLDRQFQFRFDRAHPPDVFPGVFSFSPDSQRMAYVEAVRGRVGVTDLVTQLTLATKESIGVSAIKFSPDGTKLAVGTLKGEVDLWDIDKQRSLFTLNAQAPVFSLAFSPDGRRLAALAGSTVKLWDLTASRMLFSSNSYKEPYPNWGSIEGSRTQLNPYSMPRSLSFSPDGNRLSWVNGDTVRLWDLVERREPKNLKGHTERVFDVAFSPDGQMLASASDDKTIKLWEVGTAQELSTLKGHSDAVNSVAFAPNGRQLASGGADSTVRLWDITKEPDVTTFDLYSNRSKQIAFSPDSRILVSVAEAGIRMWDVADGSPYDLELPSGGDFRSVAFAPNGKTLASGTNDGQVMLWDVASHQLIDSFMHGRFRVESLAFTSDGARLAVGFWDGNVLIRDVATKREVLDYSEPNKVTGVSFSDDGKAFATTQIGSPKIVDDHIPSPDLGVLVIRETATGRLVDRIGGPLGIDPLVSLSRNWKLLAIGQIGDLRIMNVATRAEVSRLKGYRSLSAPVFSPDEKRLATLSGKAVHLWDVASGQELITLTLKGKPDSVVFSPDGKMLAVAIHVDSFAPGLTPGAKVVVFRAATHEEVSKQSLKRRD